MENFIYSNPVRVVFGEGTLACIGKEAAKIGKRALLVSYQKTDFVRNTIEKIHRSLQEAGVEYINHFAVTANPLLSQARAGVGLCRKNRIDLVIGLGGGSVMDCAKIIAAGALYPDDVGQMIMFSHSDVRSIPPKEALPTIMIPTLPATGSEMNPTAVVTDDETRKKSYVWEPSCLYPKVALMDPELTLSLPRYQTACGAYDIISHVVEAYLNADTTLDLTVLDRMQEGVIKAVFESLDRVWENPADRQARGNLMWEASIALNGWLTSGTFGFTPMHQLGHVLSSLYNATHGATLACMMPAWMRYFASRPDNLRYRMLAKNIFGSDSLLEAADLFEKTMREHGVQTRLSEFGVTPDDIESLTDQVVSVSFGPDHRLNGRPKMSREDVAATYRLAL